eukprot:2864011-Pyramimonas_sp.AAC.1
MCPCVQQRVLRFSALGALTNRLLHARCSDQSRAYGCREVREHEVRRSEAAGRKPRRVLPRRRCGGG